MNTSGKRENFQYSLPDAIERRRIKIRILLCPEIF
jgi:hypothetical protein